MLIRVKGAPARELLKTLKERGVKPDGRFKELGLTIYLSKDELLNCEETDSTEPFCDI